MVQSSWRLGDEFSIMYWALAVIESILFQADVVKKSGRFSGGGPRKIFWHIDIQILVYFEFRSQCDAIYLVPHSLFAVSH